MVESERPIGLHGDRVIGEKDEQTKNILLVLKDVGERKKCSLVNGAQDISSQMILIVELGKANMQAVWCGIKPYPCSEICKGQRKKVLTRHTPALDLGPHRFICLSSQMATQ